METATVNEPMEETEQPLLMPEEVAANLAARDSKDTEKDMDVDEKRTGGRDSIERVEKATDETPETREDEHSTKRVGTSPAEAIATSTTEPENREVVIITDEEEKTEKRRPAREETSGRKSKEEQPRETSGQRTWEDVDSPVKSAVEPPRRRRRFLIDEDPEEEEEVIFTPIDAQPSSRKPDPLVEVEDNERDRKERKRNGKAIVVPLKKKPR